MVGDPFRSLRPITKGKGRRWVLWRPSEPQGSCSLGPNRGAPRTRAALQGVRRLAGAPGDATFARLPLLLPPPRRRPLPPAVTRDSPPASRAAAPGGGSGAPGPPSPRPPTPAGEALAPASSQPPSPRARALQSAHDYSRDLYMISHVIRV